MATVIIQDLTELRQHLAPHLAKARKAIVFGSVARGEADDWRDLDLVVVAEGRAPSWRLHTRMTLNCAVPSGRIKLVLYDGRDDSPTRGELQEIFTGEDLYALVTVPPGVWNGFKGVGTAPSIVANCAPIPHSADEVVRMDSFTDRTPYRWDLKHG